MSDCGCLPPTESLPPVMVVQPEALPDCAPTPPVQWVRPWGDAPDACDEAWTDPLYPDEDEAPADGWELPDGDGGYPYPNGTPASPPPVRPGGGATYGSTQRSWTGAKDNCPAGKVGEPYTFLLPAGSFTSKVSVAHADAQADMWLDANAQRYANQYGTCAVAPPQGGLAQPVWSGTSGCAGGPGLHEAGLSEEAVAGCPQPPVVATLMAAGLSGTGGCVSLPEGGIYGAGLDSSTC